MLDIKIDIQNEDINDSAVASQNVVGNIPRPRAFLCGVCVFFPGLRGLA